MIHLELFSSREQPEDIVVAEAFEGIFDIKTRQGDLWYLFARHDQLSVAIDIAMTLSEAVKFGNLIDLRDRLIGYDNERCNQVDDLLLEIIKEVKPDFKWVFEEFLNY